MWSGVAPSVFLFCFAPHACKPAPPLVTLGHPGRDKHLCTVPAKLDPPFEKESSLPCNCAHGCLCQHCEIMHQKDFCSLDTGCWRALTLLSFSSRLTGPLPCTLYCSEKGIATATISAYLIIVKSFWFLGSWVPQGKDKTTAGTLHLENILSRTFGPGGRLGLAL
jgi:hypothetical protein